MSGKSTYITYSCLVRGFFGVLFFPVSKFKQSPGPLTWRGIEMDAVALLFSIVDREIIAFSGICEFKHRWLLQTLGFCKWEALLLDLLIYFVICD